MINIDIVLEATSPLSLRSGREQDDASTLLYLPGTGLRGALAEAHTLLRSGNKDEFNQLFLGNEISYGNAYPCSALDRADEVFEVLPAPATAMTCKRCPVRCSSTASASPRNGPLYEPEHGLHDSLIPMSLFALSQDENDFLLSPLERCNYSADGRPPCHARLERYNGFLCRSLRQSDYTIANADTETRTRVGISRSTNAARDGILYTRQICRTGTLLNLRINAETDHADALVQFLNEVSAEGLLRVGSNRSRGLGALQLATPPKVRECSDNTTEIEHRLRQFNATLNTAAQRVSQPLPDVCYLPILLESDVILRDDLMRYLAILDEAWLAEEAGIPMASLVYQSASIRRISGWNALIGLPRPDEWSIEKGSVFVLALPNFPNTETLKQLHNLERNGTGERKVDGFGRIRFAEPFHWEAAI